MAAGPSLTPIQQERLAWCEGFLERDPDTEELIRELSCRCIDFSGPIPASFFREAEDPLERVFQWAVVADPIAVALADELVVAMLQHESVDRLLELGLLRRERSGALVPRVLRISLINFELCTHPGRELAHLANAKGPH